MKAIHLLLVISAVAIIIPSFAAAENSALATIKKLLPVFEFGVCLEVAEAKNIAMHHVFLENKMKAVLELLDAIHKCMCSAEKEKMKFVHFFKH